MSFNVRVTHVCVSSQLQSIRYLYVLCSLPVAVSVFVPVELFPQSWDELNEVEAIEAFRGCRCLTEMCVKQSQR